MNDWSDSFLDEMRLIGDDLADGVVNTIYQRGHIDSFNTLWRDLETNAQTVKSALWGYIAPFLAQTVDLPAWFDHDAYQRASAMFQRYELEIMVSMLCATFPLSFAAARPAHALVVTHRMIDNMRRRALETVQLVTDLMLPDGLSPEGRGLRSLQKVRLLHAANRHLLLTNHDWDVRSYGIPINQEDLAGTVILSSSVVIDTLPRLGVHPSEQEAADWLHVWRCFGFMLGTLPEVLPNALDEAHALDAKIRARHFAPSEDGTVLIGSLIDMMKMQLPDGPMQNVPAALIRYLAGEDAADLLGLPPNTWFHMLQPFKWAMPFLEGRPHLSGLAAKAADVMLRHIYEERVTNEIDLKRASYSIPRFLAPNFDDVLDD